MIKIFLITVLLFSSILFAQENNKTLHKIRAKAEGNMIIVKALLRSSQNQDNYVSHITAKTCNKIAFNMQISPFIQRNPIIKFKLKNDCQAKFIQYIVTDNEGHQVKKSLEIRKDFRESKTIEKAYIKHVENNISKVWDTTSIQGAIDFLYGTKQYYIKKDFVDNNIKFTRGPYLFIKSQEDLESIAIFSNSNERVTIAVIDIIENISIVDYQLHIKAKNNGLVSIVGKDRQGNLYQTTYTIEKGNCIGDCVEPEIRLNISK